MKKTLVAFLILGLNGAAMAAQPLVRIPGFSHETNTRPFAAKAIFTDSAHQEINQYCDTITQVELKDSPIHGKQILLSNHVHGNCKMAVALDARSYNLKPAQEECGTIHYQGQRVLENGQVVQIQMQDHRARRCRDHKPARLMILEGESASNQVELFSHDRSLVNDIQRLLNPHANNSPITCMAFFTGYYVDQATGSCQSGSSSGCRNPFPFSTLNECESAIRSEI